MNSTPSKEIPPPLSPRAKTLLILLLLGLLGLKFGYVTHRPFNTDEPQHLHVAWGWTQGKVQYRDYFDNHAPLFHLLMAPVVKTLGERADILDWARLAMLPFWALACAAVGWLTLRLYSPRAGLFALMLAAACPPLLLCGSEFRADILWMALWLAAIATALSGPFNRGRAFLTGLLLGACLCTSMKTTLLLAALLAAWGLLLALMQGRERREWLAGSSASLLPLLAGLSLLPLALLLFFASKPGALPALVYGVFTHNLGLPPHSSDSLRMGPGFQILLLAATAACAGWGWKLLRGGQDWQRNAHRLLALLVPLVFHLCLALFWPMVTRQDFLPCIPLLAVPMAGFLAARRSGVALLATLILIGGTSAYCTQKPFRPRRPFEEELVRNVLKLTRPGEPVMDNKGETLFRPRPFYYCLENITHWKLATGAIPDTIRQDMQAANTCVCVNPLKFPRNAQRWVERQYLPVTPKLRVAGCEIPAAPAGTPRVFEVPATTEYLLEAASGPVPATVDGTACNGPVFLRSGTHCLTCGDPRPLSLLWARALQQGFHPCHTDL